MHCMEDHRDLCAVIQESCNIMHLAGMSPVIYACIMTYRKSVFSSESTTDGQASFTAKEEKIKSPNGA